MLNVPESGDLSNPVIGDDPVDSSEEEEEEIEVDVEEVCLSFLRLSKQ
jgi:hypothetical protein